MSDKTYTEQEEKDLREKAKGLSIQNWHNMGLEKLEEKVKEAEASLGNPPPEAPKTTSDDAVAALAARLDALEEENKLLREKQELAEAGPQVGNSNTFLYHKAKAPDGKQMTVAEAEALQKKEDGWVDSPKEWKSSEPVKVPGEMYLGKVLPGGKKSVAARADGSKQA